MVKPRSTIFVEWLRGYLYLFSAPQIIDQNYVSEQRGAQCIHNYWQWSLIAGKVANVPFTLPTPENYYVHVSSEKHIKELSEAPEDRLSLHALAKDVSSISLLLVMDCL